MNLHNFPKCRNYEILKRIDEELCRYEGISREELYNQFINDKLAATLKLYNQEIDYESSILLRKESIKVLKALTKLQKYDDRAIIMENMIKDE